MGRTLVAVIASGAVALSAAGCMSAGFIVTKDSGSVGLFAAGIAAGLVADLIILNQLDERTDWGPVVWLPLVLDLPLCAWIWNQDR